jgi:hypothetical protein
MNTNDYISQEEFAEYGKKTASSKKNATEFLERIGLIDDKGNQTVAYYGRILSYDQSSLSNEDSHIIWRSYSSLFRYF